MAASNHFAIALFFSHNAVVSLVEVTEVSESVTYCIRFPDRDSNPSSRGVCAKVFIIQGVRFLCSLVYRRADGLPAQQQGHRCDVAENSLSCEPSGRCCPLDLGYSLGTKSECGCRVLTTPASYSGDLGSNLGSETRYLV